MAKEDFIQEEGTVTEALANAMFRVEIAGQSDPILCHLSGKMRKNFIRVLPGDRVIFEMSPYDLTKGRVTRRLKPGETKETFAEGRLDSAKPTSRSTTKTAKKRRRK